MVWIHLYTYFIKFGLGRVTVDTSLGIQHGKITRDEAVNLVPGYDSIFPSDYFYVFLEYADITEEHFQHIINKACSLHLWQMVNGEWQLRPEVS